MPEAKVVRTAAGPAEESEFAFEGAKGQALAGVLTRPLGRPERAAALFAHCFTCGKDVAAARHLSRALAGAGIATLRFDFTGLGASGGDFGTAGFSSDRADLEAAAAAMAAAGRPPALLVGHSLGGAAALAAAAEVAAAAGAPLSGVATIGAPSSPEHLERLFRADRDRVRSEGSAEVQIAGRPFRVSAGFLDDLEGSGTAERIAALDAPLLVMHAPLDDVVSVSHAAAIFGAAKHPKSFLSLDGADHLLSRRADAEHAARVLAAWAERSLPPRAPAPALGISAPAEGEVLVEETPGGGRLAHRATTAGHAVALGEPVPIGDGSGPTPYDALLAGLGACTSMTLRLYAERKGWPLEGVSVLLRHGRRHAQDCEGCEGAPRRVEEIAREVTLRGPLSAEQRARLLEIADRCPVHRTLTGELSITTEEAGGGEG